jgi:hypothetical protein
MQMNSMDKYLISLFEMNITRVACVYFFFFFSPNNSRNKTTIARVWCYMFLICRNVPSEVTIIPLCW